MNFASALGDLSRQTTVPKIKSRAECLMDELRVRLMIIERDKTPEQFVQIKASVAGIQMIVRRIGSLDGNLLSLETYDGTGHSVTLAPVEQVAITVQIVSDANEQRRFVGMNMSTHPSRPLGS